MGKKQKPERCKRINYFVADTVRVVAGFHGFYFTNPNNQLRLSVDPSRVKSKTFLVELFSSGRKEPLAVDTKAPWQRVVWYVREACLGAKDGKAAIRVFGRILPGGPTKEMRRLLRWHEKLGCTSAANPTEPEDQKSDEFVPKAVPAPPTGMTNAELLEFNPILRAAFEQCVDKNDPFIQDMMREIVAAAIKTGAAPEKIYAMIKTGRMVTDVNIQFLSEADLKEWSDAAEEYKRLAKPD